jgi:hypothetical protein
MAKEKASRAPRRARTKPEELPALPAAISEAATISATPEGGDSCRGIDAAPAAPPAGPDGPDASVELLGPLTDPRLAAFEAGRLLNRLRFHLQQVWFVADAQQYYQVTTLTEELSRRVRDLVPAAQRSSLQQRIRETVAGLRAQYEFDEQHGDWVNALYDGLVRDRHLEPTDGWREILGPVLEQCDAMGEAIRDGLDHQLVLAMELGELVDQGACPARLYQHPGPRPRPPSPGSRTWVWGDSRPPQQPQRYFGSWRPGDLPPWPDWAGDVRHVWTELGMPAPPPAALEIASVSASTLEEEADVAVGMVERLAGLAREGLRQLATPSPATGPAPDPEAPGIDDEIDAQPAGPQEKVPARSPERLTIDPDTFSVTLDGKTDTVNHPGAFHFFKMIADARGQLVSRETLEQAPACKGRVDKLRTHLPKRLNSLIKSRAGNGGGYWLQLPPKKTRP